MWRIVSVCRYRKGLWSSCGLINWAMIIIWILLQSLCLAQIALQLYCSVVQRQNDGLSKVIGLINKCVVCMYICMGGCINQQVDGYIIDGARKVAKNYILAQRFHHASNRLQYCISIGKHWIYCGMIKLIRDLSIRYTRSRKYIVCYGTNTPRKTDVWTNGQTDNPYSLGVGTEKNIIHSIYRL